MYTIECDGVLIYDDTLPVDELRVVSPKLKMAENSAGSLEMTLPPGSLGYDLVKKMTSRVVVKCGGSKIWEGRVLTEDEDFWKRRKLCLEGELAYLNDTIQPPSKESSSVRGFLEKIINIHNSKVDETKQFKVGYVDPALEPEENIDRTTNYETTLECINNKLLEVLGGHIEVRYETDGRYIDYTKSYHNLTEEQEIRFGTNLLDLTKSYDLNNLVSVIVPRGARLDESSIEDLEAYVNLSTCEIENEYHEKKSLYVKNQKAIDKYGWIELVVDFEDVKNKDILLQKAMDYFDDKNYDEISLELKAIDLKYLNPRITSLKLYDQVKCISKPHGLVEDGKDDTGNLTIIFPVTELDLALDRPDNSTFTLGTSYKEDYTENGNKIEEHVKNVVYNEPSSSALMTQARENTRNLINATSNGVITTLRYPSDHESYPNQPYAMLIQDGMDPYAATGAWIFKEGGLVYAEAAQGDVVLDKEGKIKENALIRTGMTKDGSIMADLITAGTMSCDRLNGGKINGQHIIGGDIYGAYIYSKKNYGNGQGYVEIEGAKLHIHDGEAYNNFLSMTSFTQPGKATTLGSHTWSCTDGQGYLQISAYSLFQMVANNSSDRRLKTCIEDFNVGISKELILNAKLKQFYMRGKRKFGVIAQDVQEQIKDNVDFDRYNLVYEDGGYLAVSYQEYIPHLMKIAQEQQKEIYELKTQVKDLANQIKDMRKEKTDGNSCSEHKES